tara:strand:+ start:79 stop:624 length:546 start_codon:yes stop_codon:yes gene_type:complete
MTQPASLGNLAHGSRPDDRAGLGYGQLNPKFHKDRQAVNSFPYKEEDEYEDEDISDIPIEMQDKLRKVIGGYLASDYLAVKGTDPFYYAAGNTKMGEAVGTSISPMPGMYKKRTQVGGGVNSPKAFTPGSLQQTGSTIGYSHPHVSLGADRDIYFSDIDEEDEELPLKRVRMVIRKMLENE